MTVFGWDMSDYDHGRGAVNIRRAAAEGIRFLTHKATEGTSIKHHTLGTDLAAARGAGIPLIGAYHVVHTGNIAAQVDYLLAYCDAQAPWWRAFPGWFWQVDAERWSNDFPDPGTVIGFGRLLAARTGKKVITYASRGQYGNRLTGVDMLWNADYGTRPAGPFQAAYQGDDYRGWLLYSGQEPRLLQYTDRAVIGGLPGCDANACRGTLGQLQAALTHGAAPAAQPATPPGDTDMLMLIRQDGDNAVYLTNGMTRRWVQTPAELDQLRNWMLNHWHNAYPADASIVTVSPADMTALGGVVVGEAPPAPPAPPTA
jgi:GH25 family lysozyme M1 (1,4-beta-N-acetylmuramidase)